MPTGSATSAATPVIMAADAVMGGGGGGDAFYDPPAWRWVVADFAGPNQITMLDRIVLQFKVQNLLTGAARAELTVPSEDPRVNILYTDSPTPFPYVHEGCRFLYGWREENPGDIEPFVLRYGAPILQVQDEARTDLARTNITAFDPRMYLYAIPVLKADGAFLGPKGITFPNSDLPAPVTGDQIVRYLIETGQLAFSHPLFMEEGVVETTLEIEKITFQRGSSVGQAIEEMQSQGYLDFRCLPRYDPSGSTPQVCSTWNVYSQMGAERPNAIFGWGTVPRSLVGASNLLDGSSRANFIQYYRGQGGPPVNPFFDIPAETTYGPYVSQQFFPGKTARVAVEALAEQQLSFRKAGKQTIRIMPQPLRSPVPYTDFDLGDRPTIRWSERMRMARDGQSRVSSFTVEGGIDFRERLSEVGLSPEGLAA